MKKAFLNESIIIGSKKSEVFLECFLPYDEKEIGISKFKKLVNAFYEKFHIFNIFPGKILPTWLIHSNITSKS